MLPTKGYFQDIECPYYDSTCNRPYCHFRHRKKPQETSDDPAIETTKEPEVPTYKPTPKSELANIKSHIPISYVPDLAFRPDRTIRQIPKFTYEKPTYKPTPLSILSSANKPLEEGQEEKTEEDLKAIREVKQNIANVEYNPEVSDINFEELSAEFELIDDIIEIDTNKAESEKKNGEGSKSESEKRHKSKHRTKDKSRDKSKDSRKHRSSRHKSSRDKEKSSRDKDREKKKSSSSSSKSKDKHKDKKKPEDSNNTEKKLPEKYSSLSSDDDNLAQLIDEDFEEDTLSECYKIFQEYEPPPKLTEKAETIEDVQSELTTCKKRIAHASAQSNDSLPKMNHQSKPKIPTPGEILTNRFKVARVAQANNEQKNIMNAMKRPPPTLLEAARSYKQQKLAAPKPDIVDSILNSSKNKIKKIAPVQNVNSIQRAKAKIEELAKQRAVEAVNKTPAQTVKGNKRVAHVPDYSLSDIPDVLNSDKSKLPINVRTRFLTMIADECVKLYLTKEDAYNRALNEEFTCYEKCKVLLTYKNSAMLAVNRLRKEHQEREKAGLGPIGDGESSEKDTSSDFKGRSFYNHIRGYVLTEEELDIHGYPKESTIPGRASIKNRKIKNDSTLSENQRKCARCSKIYLVDEDGFVLYPEECIYHPLKKRTLRGEQTYLCCKSNDGVGCVTSNTHVTDYCDDSELEGFQTTMDPESEDDPRSYAVYALDCEMCYTIKGLELTRVTIVDSDCKTVYESLVKPLNPIIDYNTTFSGITREQMERTSTSILQVQANILHLCNSKTILIGHSLESDMKALKIIHGTVIDTSVLFPHKMGLPHKRALKVLASEFLKKIIQNSVSGHDSAEDAITCMELVKWKLKEEMKVRGR